jgi:non-specific serine/threonine protein kinase
MPEPPRIVPNNLPAAITSFIGRVWELTEVRRALEGTRLLTLIGAGGVGKTRLALQLAAEVPGLCPDGVWLVELATVADPALVPQAIAQVLGVREEPRRPLHDVLLAYLNPRQLLLVLDNCEHLIEACATLVTELLRSCPLVTVLATSREALDVLGESVWRVPSLALPDPERLPEPEYLPRYDAVRLFMERARASQSDFLLTTTTAPVVARLCRRLDGIPLALELAAAQLKLRSLDAVTVGLDDRFALLAQGNRAALPRQQTLRATLDWSYDLLTVPERRLLDQLAACARCASREVAGGGRPVGDRDPVHTFGDGP